MKKIEKRLKLNDTVHCFSVVILFCLLIYSLIFAFNNIHDGIKIIYFLPPVLFFVLICLTYRQWYRIEDKIVYKHHKKEERRQLKLQQEGKLSDNINININNSEDNFYSELSPFGYSRKE